MLKNEIRAKKLAHSFSIELEEDLRRMHGLGNGDTLAKQIADILTEDINHKLVTITDKNGKEHNREDYFEKELPKSTYS